LIHHRERENQQENSDLYVKCSDEIHNRSWNKHHQILAFNSIASFYNGDETKSRKYFQNKDTTPHRMFLKTKTKIYAAQNKEAPNPNLAIIL
jgi:hypothetical protein